MKQYFAALEALLDAIDPLQPIENLKVFGGIDAITRVLEQSLDIPLYAAEKLQAFRWEALYAIVPGEQTRHLPAAHYLAEARFSLRQASELMVVDG